MRDAALDLDESYSQWVRRTVARRGAAKPLISLFDSSVPEPRELLTALVADAFAVPVSSRYTSAFAQGNPFVVDWLCAHYGVSAEGVFCTTGATRALSLLYRALVGEDEGILVETPGFDLFQDLAHHAGRKVSTFVRGGPAFALDVRAIEERLTPETRLVVLSNLHNPSGEAAPYEVLRDIAALAERRDLIVVVDEVYGDYAGREVRPVHAAALSPRFVGISSLTKNFGLSSLRCGWIVGDPAILARVRDLAGRIEFGISNLSHAVAALVLENSAVFTAYSQNMVAEARGVIGGYFADWRRDGLIDGRLPPYGCIAFPRLVDIGDSAAFAEWLGDRTGVVVAPGEYFGAPGHIRIGFGCEPDLLDEGLRLLGEGLRSYGRAAQRSATA
ncbi:pyridoxal phosphate-dependent aminotransferase [Sphingopyxis sp. GW247-27LB]|uniref:pyridoxal phosphate-dependent aminotransferase n=1 Tax=Sphingopyxis sp. GW247-27LB TaxID=2012632 RepID=UPI000BA793C2|nr:pyridoxal phosphate-dependent aminotransferase [Sphingopyxis sp. GW247-27LB]PAL22708.1 aminotransferase [Sphingopyxis sp. GW247-27LB]